MPKLWNGTIGTLIFLGLNAMNSRAFYGGVLRSLTESCVLLVDSDSDSVSVVIRIGVSR